MQDGSLEDRDLCCLSIRWLFVVPLFLLLFNSFRDLKSQIWPNLTKRNDIDLLEKYFLNKNFVFNIESNINIIKNIISGLSINSRKLYLITFTELNTCVNF